MKVIYHIDNNCSNVGPVVRALADFHRAKGLSKVYLGITLIGAYEKYKLHQFVEIEKQGREPNIEGFPFSEIIEYGSSANADAILGRITAMIAANARRGPIGEPYFAAYRAFFKQQKARSVPLPAEPDPLYRKDATDIATINNNLLIMRAISTHEGKGDAIDREKRNLDEDERANIIKDIFAAPKAEPEVHIVVSNDNKYTRDLASLTDARALMYHTKAGRDRLSQKDAVFVISPQQLVEDLQDAITIEKYGGHDSRRMAMASALKQCEAVIRKGKLSKHLQTELNPRQWKSSPDFSNSYLEFLTNPPVAVAGQGLA